MSDKEIVWNAEIGTWEMCSTCLDVAMDAANSNGFHIGDEEFEYTVEEDFDTVPLDDFEKLYVPQYGESWL